MDCCRSSSERKRDGSFYGQGELSRDDWREVVSRRGVAWSLIIAANRAILTPPLACLIGGQGQKWHMIQEGTQLTVADNTGAKTIECFKVLGGSRRRYAAIGDIIVASVKKAEPRRAVKRKEIVRAVVVRQKKAYRRFDGSYIRFDENAAVILDGRVPKGGRIFGPIPREIKEKGFDKIASLAVEVL